MTLFYTLDLRPTDELVVTVGFVTGLWTGEFSDSWTSPPTENWSNTSRLPYLLSKVEMKWSVEESPTHPRVVLAFPVTAW